MAYTKISTETVLKNKKDWAITFSPTVAKLMSKVFKHKIYQIENGAFVIRKPTGDRLTLEVKALLQSSGQYSWE